MAVALILAAAIWGMSALMVLSVAILSRRLPIVSDLLFKAPAHAEPRRPALPHGNARRG